MFKSPQVPSRNFKFEFDEIVVELRNQNVQCFVNDEINAEVGTVLLH